MLRVVSLVRACALIAGIGSAAAACRGSFICESGQLAACKQACDERESGPSCTRTGAIYDNDPEANTIAPWAHVERVTGPGVDQRSAARSYYLRGCVLNDASGCYLAGLSFFLEPAGDRSKSKEAAKRAFETACSLKRADGCAMWAAVSADTDAPEATAKYYNAACNVGSSVGCSLLAECYIEGRGVPTDLVQARTLLARACNDDPGACDRLRALSAASAGDKGSQ